MGCAGLFCEPAPAFALRRYPMDSSQTSGPRNIGLALSGGGVRAAAFQHGNYR